jgi:hypothetical protein
MRTTTYPDPVDQRPPPAGRGRLLRRLLARRLRPGPTTPFRPAVRRVWREVAPGEWRWLHRTDEAEPR